MRTSIIVLLLAISSLTNAQVFNPTGGWAGANTIPPGWTSTGSASSSTVTSYGSGNGAPGEGLFSPWVLAPLPNPPSGQTHFLSQFSNNNLNQKAETKIYSLQPGIWYEVKYHVMTASYKLNGGVATDLADKAFIEVTGGPGAVASHTFSQGLTWTEGTLKFQASGSVEVFKFNVTENTAAGAVANLDITSIKMVCGQPDNQIGFEHPVQFLKCPQSTINLNDSYTGYIPTGSSLVWYSNPTHSGKALIGTNLINQPGDYYAFFYDKDRNCFNTDLAEAKVKVMRADVKLKSDVGQITCHGVTTFDLNTLHDTPPGDIPPGASLVWFNNPTHSGFPSAMGNATSVVPGTYYAFYYFGAPYNCYNTDLSTDVVQVKLPTQVNLGQHQRLVVCTSGTAQLFTEAFNVPLGTRLVYFDNPQGQGQPIQAGTSMPIGQYYAFSQDTLKGCLNTNLSTEVLTISQIAAPVISPDTVTAQCGSRTFDLTQIQVGATLGQVHWYPTPNRVPYKLGTFDPTKVKPGNYYAFIYDQVSKCYNVPISNSKLTVLDTVCLERSVKINFKVKLQGAISGQDTVMKNTLQTYVKGPGMVGLLPTTDPYGNGIVYEDVNNLNGVLGAVVDWVKIEIRSSQSPGTILESGSYLLKPDGSVVTFMGSAPYFESRTQPVHVVVKHRNHVAIMSQPLSIDGSIPEVEYNFTTSLQKAFTNGIIPDQMRQVNGVWCMVSGDVSQNLMVKNEDMSQTRNSYNQGLFGVYSSRDLNMNGLINNQDVNIQRNRYNVGYFSILTKY
ncbi:hypothetical protein [Dyadobacter sp. CY343]|uniref:hypothetical protein n=1 Tax=Dyadobacter sp. CY343 TaxID=2907299 RepID=UPI001F230CB4|nr:hypothetical protein [Dyadobacter sp. CY343]MCE7059860.1 hypothetical protein [Dyadobacter sp. CY343]